MRALVLKSLAAAIALIQLTACAPTNKPHPSAVSIDPDYSASWRYHYPIKFAPKSTTLTKEALSEIEIATQMMTRVNVDAFGLTGYGDSTGSERAKRNLALRRVKVVADEMVRRGVPRAIIVINDYVWTDRHPRSDTGAIGSVEVDVLLDAPAPAARTQTEMNPL